MINWVCKSFNELTVWELYEILQLRNEVFVVEQNCPYQDCDGKDPLSCHFMGFEDGALVAYTRLIPAGVSYKEISIGRVVNSPSVRGRGVGKELMERSIKQIFELYGRQDIMIGAQLYLNKFYTELGFINEGEIYLEDGIEHIHMRYTAG
jgi:ElaA protein